MVDFYSRFLTPGDLSYDIGANMGGRTTAFRDLGARVLAVEPQTTCVRHLRAVFATDPNVIIAATAVGDHEGHADLAICDWSPTISTLSDVWQHQSRFARDHQWTRIERVPLTTLDKLIEQYGTPQFCKIDVEGFEASVLSGLTQTIPFLSYEFQGEFLGQAYACAGHLLTLGHAMFNYSLGESMELHLSEWISADALFQVLKQDTSKDIWGDIYVSFK